MGEINERLISILAIELICFLGVARIAAAASPATKIVIVYASLNERGAGALLVARDQGFFRKYDLDVNLIYMRNAAVALSALSAGEAQFYSGSANGSVLGAIANGLDLAFVAGLANKLNGTMVASPAIQSPADLKGKNIGIQSIGGGIWMITQLVLEHWGLEPKRDAINLRIVGDESVMVQALMLGSIDAPRRLRLRNHAQKAGVPSARRFDQTLRAVPKHGDPGATQLRERQRGHCRESDPRLGRSDHVYSAPRQQSRRGRDPDKKSPNRPARRRRGRL
jgi:hypothetical protein